MGGRNGGWEEEGRGGMGAVTAMRCMLHPLLKMLQPGRVAEEAGPAGNLPVCWVWAARSLKKKRGEVYSLYE